MIEYILLHNYCFHLILDPNEDPRHINMKTIATCVQIIFLISQYKFKSFRPPTHQRCTDGQNQCNYWDTIILINHRRRHLKNHGEKKFLTQSQNEKNFPMQNHNENFFQNTKSQREKSLNTKSQALRFLSHHSQLQGLSLMLLSLGKKLCYLSFFFCLFL